MRTSRWIGLAVVLAALFAAPASALPADKHIEVEADNGQGCLGDLKTDCYRVTNGDLDGFEQGGTVHVMLTNVGDTGHNMFVTTQANADSNNVDTSADDAINGTKTIDAGASTNLTFTIPDDAEGLYFWCDVQTHEAGGMWLEADVSEATADDSSDDGNDGDQTGSDDQNGDTDGADGGSGDGEDEPSGVPGFGLAATIVVALGLAGLRRRAEARR